MNDMRGTDMYGPGQVVPLPTGWDPKGIHVDAATGEIKESDPTGRSAKDAGAKLDQGKNRLGLVLMDFADALIEVGKVGTFGANKYTPHGWISVPEGEQRYTDALFRHLFAEASGEEVDVDSQMLHAAQTAWNALARLQLILNRKKSPTPNAEESCPTI